MSFEAAMARLGGSSLSVGSVEACSIAKGETLADTIRVVSGYADAIVLRHPKEGAARLASEFATVPVINAGDGAGQHPSQNISSTSTRFTSRCQSTVSTWDSSAISVTGALHTPSRMPSHCIRLDCTRLLQKVSTPRSTGIGALGGGYRDNRA